MESKAMEAIGLLLIVLVTVAFSFTWRAFACVLRELERLFAEVNNIREELRAFYKRDKQDGE